jgi:hypothetical protein
MDATDKDIVFLDDIVDIPGRFMRDFKVFDAMTAGVHNKGFIQLYLIQKNNPKKRFMIWNHPAEGSQDRLMQQAKEYLHDSVLIEMYLAGYLITRGLPYV